MIPSLLVQFPPDDCLLSGLCGGRPDQVGPGSGLMFLALGLVALGTWGLWTTRRSRRSARR